jgi:dUTP pyrophosphatase
LEVKFKKLHPLSQTPTRANKTDAGLDLTATSIDRPYSGVFNPLKTSARARRRDYVEVGTGISFEIPEGYVGLLFPRSSISQTKHFLRNSVGVIDSGYRGEVKLRFSLDDGNSCYKVGDKVGQIIFIKLPTVQLTEVEELPPSERGGGGFGSSGT